MKVLILESFYTSSHKTWADGLAKYSYHTIGLLTLPGRHWKWRMHNAGRIFAKQIIELKEPYDLILCTDLMNVAEFRGILSALGNAKSWFNNIPVVTYFHENQITYPWSQDDPDVKLNRDNHYGWINYVSCLASDRIAFNSEFHKSNFLQSIPGFLKQFPDDNHTIFLNQTKSKSTVLPIGLDLRKLAASNRTQNEYPTILWNHRWEYDKNPESFFQILFKIKDKGFRFNLIVAGESYRKYPKIFDLAKEKLADEIIHFGFAEDRAHYENLLLQSDILPVTSNQDFFGISAVEAIAAGCLPLLPNRLAFPEHLDQKDQKHCYYDNDQELYEKLLHNVSRQLPKTEKLRTQILKYDWSIVGPKYDSFFEEAVFNYMQY